MKFNKDDLQKNIPETEGDYDVIVAGGGPAGIGAALAAGCSGARTLILESRSQFGGTATTALWMSINWIFADNNETSRGGVHKLLVDRIRSYGDIASVPGNRGGTIDGGNLDIHPEFLKLALFELFEEYNIDYQLYSPVTDVIKDKNELKGVKIKAKEGTISYRGKVIIDATGDGDVAWKAGCEMTEGREEDGKHMPITLVFALANVDTEKFFNKNQEKFHRLLDKARKEEKYNITAWYGFDKTTIPGVVSVNNAGSWHLNLDGTKSSDLTIMERLGLQIAMDFVSFVKEYNIPGMEDCHLVRTGDFVSIRDTRRLVGEYVLTEKDIMEGKKFDDVIARKYGAIDAVGFRGGEPIKQGADYPYRSLLPKSIDNLLVAGRCGSATFMGHAGGKSMGNMISIGQGAGVAAALAAKRNRKPRHLNIKDVQKKLADILDNSL